MNRRLAAAVAGIVFGCAIVAAPAKADPSVTGIAAGSIALFALGVYANTPQPDAAREFVVGGAGIFDVVDDEDRAFLYAAEYRPPVTFFRFRPIIGLIGTSDKAVGGYLGLRHEVNFGENVYLAHDIAATGYASGDGKNLGASAVLRTGVEVGLRFDNGIRVSGAFHHMSHGKLFDDENPGTETATFSVAVPTDVLFGGQLFEGKHYWPKLLGW